VVDGTVRARVYERGVGETAASGSGGCAARIGASLLAGAARCGPVLLPGGPLHVTWDDRVRQRGPAAAVFTGELARTRDECGR